MTSFTPAPVKPYVSLSVLESLDVRLGSIQVVQDVPGSRKLMKLTVSFGDHTRSIVAGLKLERPDPAALVGRQALFVINLEPRRMAGELSEGMLFDIGYADGLMPVLAVPERALPDGARAG
jgi:tRNA-binding protein